MNISVIICTHNPRPEYLARCLAALKAQSLERGAWELLVIDNRSDVPMAQQLELSWHPQARCIREDTLGLTHARLRGIREARNGLLVFVDDDNLLDPDYLAGALEIAAEYPHIGIWSGSCVGELEIVPDPDIQKYLQPLCITQFARDAWSNFPFQNQGMPSGAGLCIRAAAAKAYLELHERGERPVMLDRAGQSLMSGGDVDMALTAADHGFGMGVFTRLKLIHLIPAFRLEKSYLLRLAEAMAASSVVLDVYHPPPFVPSGSALRRAIANMLRKALLSRTDRQFFRASEKGRARGLKLAAEMKARTDAGRGGA